MVREARFLPTHHEASALHLRQREMMPVNGISIREVCFKTTGGIDVYARLGFRVFALFSGRVCLFMSI